jgi:prephenate dehydrogenase
MTAYRHVALIGVGLLGGSIGSALRRGGLAERVVGYARKRETLALAVQQGACDQATTDFDAAVRGADVVVVCTPVQTVAKLALAAEGLLAERGFVTDVGSVKASIVAEVEANGGRRFVGSHPMAGSEKTGVEHSRPDLFANALTFVTPTSASDPALVQKTAEFWSRLGCRVKQMSPEAHDVCVAATSHVPHLVASLLAASTPEDVLDCVAGGWKDSTRVAAGDIEMWRQIVCENRAAAVAGLDRFLAAADTMRRSLASGDDDVWIRILEEGKRRRDAVGS